MVVLSSEEKVWRRVLNWVAGEAWYCAVEFVRWGGVPKSGKIPKNFPTLASCSKCMGHEVQANVFLLQALYRRERIAWEEQKYGRSFTPAKAGGPRRFSTASDSSGAHSVSSASAAQSYYLASNCDDWDEHLLVNLSDPSMKPQWRRLLSYEEMMCSRLLPQPPRPALYK